MLKKALEDARLTVPEVWMKYFSFGGAAGEYEIDAYINGSLSLPPLQRDILAHAANELIDQLPARPRAPYCAEVTQSRAADGREANGRDAGNDPPHRHRRNTGGD
ncbi:hypothetical protein N2K95_01910 [Arthrobacter zhaoxinii]|uniref:Uncharacterized protein n=1 Tax=Arthrobacter zhaoxinii TaxID=2964616 RepID=A0ABY5YRB3_9MICC|nr:hypothetical protein [Arthrobacter zhaoxinii]UWX97473.1 hypothetical protein N2K95_01910 [Arthrobacter zhaoxinii]